MTVFVQRAGEQFSRFATVSWKELTQQKPD